MPPSSLQHRKQLLTERARHAIERLQACSPRSLTNIADTLVRCRCAPCSVETERCDACEARSELAALCRTLAAINDGHV